MTGIKPYNIKPIAKDLDNVFRKTTGINPVMNLDKILNQNLIKNKKLLSTKMEDYLLVFDEGIKTIIRIHELCKQNQIDNNKKGFSFTVLTAKLVTLSIGIRQMLYSGFVDCTKNLYRPFIETIDVIFACLVNPDLNNSFAKINEIYDSNDFYWKNFAKNKLEKDHLKLFKKIKITDDYINYIIERRKSQRSFLSESIHVSFSSSMANFLMSTIDWKMSDNYYGKITTAYPQLLMQIIEEIYLYNQIFFKTIDQKISPDFEHVKIDLLTDHYYRKFDSLYTLYCKPLYEKAEDFTKVFREIQDDLKNNNANNT